MDIIKELKTNGMLLQKVSKKEQTIEICEITIKQNPLALKFASKKCLNSKICLMAVKNNVKAFQYVPSEFITKEMCKLAVESYPKFLKKVTENFKTPEICINAVKKSIKTLLYVPEEKRYELFNDKTDINLIKKIVSYDYTWLKYMPNRPDVRKLCIEYMKKDFSITLYMPEQMKISDDILAYQKSMGKLQFVSKFYNADRKIFAISIKVVYDKIPSLFDENIMEEKTYEVTKEFNDFDGFYDFLNGNLFDAGLLEYDFSGIDLKKYNIKGAIIKADILDSQGLYDGTYYSDIKKHINTEEIIANNGIAITDRFYYPKPIDEQGEARCDNEHITFFYISDIHLTHRVYNMFGEGKATKEEIRYYIRCLVREMVNSIGTKPLNSYLLIAGDTSSRFEFTCIFYKELIKYWSPREIVVVAGNHELIDPWVEIEKNI